MIVEQIESLNSKHGCSVPLILMNTIRTHDGTLKVVEKYFNRSVDIQTLCQSPSHLINKGQDNEDESYHFDHRELSLSLKNSGTLDALMLQGKEYILVVKYDNLGAVIDSKILNHLIQNGTQFCTEVAPSTSPDFRGSIFSSHEGKFQLSENAQMSDKHSMEKFKLVDTGNLWMSLKAMKKLVETDELENYPVSKSDLYTYAEGVLTRNSARKNPANPSIELGPEFEKLGDFRSRFKSIPSIIELDSLKVMGDVWFGTGITLKGKVTIVAKPGIRLEIPDGVVLEDKEITDPGDI
ncbi:UTP--glucose-1-phosphate uridylyltransferase [Sarracenia purpurea var. burkii]